CLGILEGNLPRHHIADRQPCQQRDDDDPDPVYDPAKLHIQVVAGGNTLVAQDLLPQRAHAIAKVRHTGSLIYVTPVRYAVILPPGRNRYFSPRQTKEPPVKLKAHRMKPMKSR